MPHDQYSQPLSVGDRVQVPAKVVALTRMAGGTPDSLVRLRTSLAEFVDYPERLTRVISPDDGDLPVYDTCLEATGWKQINPRKWRLGRLSLTESSDPPAGWTAWLSIRVAEDSIAVRLCSISNRSQLRALVGLIDQGE